MDTGNLLQGLGLVVCIGAILLVVLAVAAFRAMSRRNNPPQEPTIWNTRGEERPTYDQPDIQTRGGFGGMPATGSRDTVMDRDFDEERNPYVDRESGERASSGDRLVDYNRDRGSEQSDMPPRKTGGFGGQQNAPRPRRDRADDDDIRSSGGFGGG